jgi:predicted metal-binding membrane protein
MEATSRPRETDGTAPIISAAGLLKHAPMRLLLALIVLTASAWAVTVIQALNMKMPMGVAIRAEAAADGMAGMAMAGASAGGWSVSATALFLAVWTIMMVAMMLPAAAPMILTFASAQARRGREAALSTWIFIAGYLLVWAAAGAVVYLGIQIAADVAMGLDLIERARWAPIALGVALAVAGFYQLTPLKRVCLIHCRSPFAFVAEYWREGRVGALAMGLRHGAYCLGCCWALFAVLTAAGVMSLAWMLLLTLVVFAEKVLPHGRITAAATGIVLIVLGAAVSLGAVRDFISEIV